MRASVRNCSDGHVTRVERLLELSVAAVLCICLIRLLDLSLRHNDVLRLGLLGHRRVGDELIEHVSQDFVAAVRRNRDRCRASMLRMSRSNSIFFTGSPLTRASTSGNCAGIGFGGAGGVAGLSDRLASRGRCRRGGCAEIVRGWTAG